MKDVARIILTLECNRGCSYCVNNYDFVLEEAVELGTWSRLKDYKIVCITGGEPLLKPDWILTTVRALKKQNPSQKVYLYASIYDDYLEVLMHEGLDGVNFTLHQFCTEKDRRALEKMESLIRRYPGSFRLSIDRSIGAVTFTPPLWKNIKLKDWKGEDEAAVNPNEDLYIWWSAAQP